MRNTCLLGLLIIWAVLSSGCAKPYRAITSKSPVEGVFLTTETYRGYGPTSPEVTQVYAHFERHGRAKRILVLDGADLTIGRIVWNGPGSVTLCLDGGYTSTFRNEVTLILGDTPDEARTIRFRLDDSCPG